MADATVFATRISGNVVPGGGVVQLWRVFNSETVNGAVNVDSLLSPVVLGFEVGECRSFGVWVDAAGSGPDFDLQIMQSWDDTAANYVVPDSSGTVMTVTSGTARVNSVSPVAMQRLRFRL